MSYERLTDKNWRRRAYQFDETYKRLAELEDKIERGTLMELPYKIGDIVYVIYTNRETYELDVRITDVVGYEIMRGELWAKTSIPYRKCYIEIENVFRTRVEAEAKLKELQEKQK